MTESPKYGHVKVCILPTDDAWHIIGKVSRALYKAHAGSANIIRFQVRADCLRDKNNKPDREQVLAWASTWVTLGDDEEPGCLEENAVDRKGGDL